MAYNFKDDDQFFVVMVGTKRGNENPNEFGNVLMGIVAIAIVMMVFVGLLKDAETKRLQYPVRSINPYERGL